MLASGLGQSTRRFRLAQHALDRLCQRGWILRWHDQPGNIVDHDLAETGPVGGDHRPRTAQRLAQHHAEGLAGKTGPDHNIGQGKIAWHFAMRDRAQEGHTVAKPQSLDQSFKLAAIGAFGADQQARA